MTAHSPGYVNDRSLSRLCKWPLPLQALYRHFNKKKWGKTSHMGSNLPSYLTKNNKCMFHFLSMQGHSSNVTSYSNHHPQRHNWHFLSNLQNAGDLLIRQQLMDTLKTSKNPEYVQLAIDKLNKEDLPDDGVMTRAYERLEYLKLANGKT